MSFRFVPTQRVIQNTIKIAKKFKKNKKYHYGSISSHHRLKKDEKGGKEKLSFHSVPTWRITENCKQIAKNFKKLKKSHRGKEREREKIKVIGLFRSYPSRYRKFQKNSKKIQKIKKYHNGFISSQNRLKDDEKERK